MSTYRYKWESPPLERVKRGISEAMQAVISMTAPAPQALVDVSLTGETEADKLDLDGTMLGLGWEFLSMDPPAPPQVILLRQEVTANLTADANTDSDAFTNLLTVEITTGAGVIGIMASATTRTADAEGNIRVTVNGTPIRSSGHPIGIANTVLSARVPVPPGTYTVALQWRAGVGGTHYARPVSYPADEFAGLLVRETTA
jgi:hypothetical protein